jgi:dihydrofolate reductase
VVDGGIYVSGSATLVRAMIADGLVDELHLFVYPLALGCDAFESGVLHLTYRHVDGA